MRILIDGPDGAGKTTVLTKLAEHYQKGSTTCLRVNDPNHMLGTRTPDEPTHQGGIVKRGQFVSIRDIIMRPANIGFAGALGEVDDIWPKTIQEGSPLPPEIARLLILAGEVVTDRQVDAVEQRYVRDDLSTLALFDRWATSTLVYQALTTTNDEQTRKLRVQAVVDNYLAHCRARFDLTVILCPIDEAGYQKVFARTRTGEDEDNVFNPEDETEAWLRFKARADAFRNVFNCAQEYSDRGTEFVARFGAVGGIHYVDAADTIEENVDTIIHLIDTVKGGAFA
mgnify:CR=1 FL=1